MNDDAFRQLVAEMRHAQKEYFRTRSSSALEQSKRLERQVDEALREDRSGQRSLWEAEAK